MPLKCRIVENRSVARVFKERDAARIVCRVVRAGGSKAKIDALYTTICQDKPEKRDKSQAEVAIEIAINQLGNSNEEFDADFRLFEQINGILNAIIPFFRFFRVGGLLGKAGSLFKQANRAQETIEPGLITGTLGNIRAQQAANSQTMDFLRQAAANEARFRMTGTR